MEKNPHNICLYLKSLQLKTLRFHHKKRCSLLLFVLNSSRSLIKITRNKKEREDVHIGNAEVPSQTLADAMTSHIEKESNHQRTMKTDE